MYLQVRIRVGSSAGSLVGPTEHACSWAALVRCGLIEALPCQRQHGLTLSFGLQKQQAVQSLRG